MFPIALIAFIEYMYYQDFLLLALESPLISPVVTYVNLGLNSFLITMLFWSLASVYFTNPGYTRDFIRSERVGEDEELNVTNYDVFLINSAAQQVED